MSGQQLEDTKTLDMDELVNNMENLDIDISEKEYENRKKDLLKLLQDRQADREKIEKETRCQSNCPAWHKLRMNMITASNFGRICRMRPNTDTGVFIQNMLYEMRFVNVPALQWGKDNESVVKEKLREDKNWDIQDCGLFIHKIHSFLGASPDGLIGEDGVLEIKCPYSARTMDPEVAIKEGKIDCFKKNGTLNCNHRYYYQIQGQLEITDRQYCQFVVWTLEGYKCVRIERDETFWKENMEGNLETFFFRCLLPELVDPRKRRNMPMRSITLGSIV